MKSPREGAGETVKQTAIHPGEVLADGLQALSMSGATLARELNVPTDHIEMAMGLQRVTAPGNVGGSMTDSRLKPVEGQIASSYGAGLGGIGIGLRELGFHVSKAYDSFWGKRLEQIVSGKRRAKVLAFAARA